MKLQYYYIGKTWSKDISTKPFKAVKIKIDGNDTLIPVILNSWERNKEITPSTEIFIYGVGRKKVGKRKLYEIPLFDNEAEHWNDYINQYGKYCLFFSLTGNDYDSMDCCLTSERNEFNSINNYGAVEYVDFIENFLRINELQRKVLEQWHNTYYGSGYSIDRFVDKYLFRPCYNIYWLSFQYSTDVLEDDKRMEEFYEAKRTKELYLQHPLYKKHEELRAKAEAFKNQCNQQEYGWSWKQLNEEGKCWEDLCQDYGDIDRQIYKEVSAQAKNEINEDNDVFPTCMKDRIKFLYGEECEQRYSYICDKYLSTDDKEKDVA